MHCQVSLWSSGLAQDMGQAGLKHDFAVLTLAVLLRSLYTCSPVPCGNGSWSLSSFQEQCSTPVSTSAHLQRLWLCIL